MKDFLQKYWVAIVLGLIVGFGLHILFCQFLYENKANAEIPPPLPCQQEFKAGWTLMSMPHRPYWEGDNWVGWKEIYTEGIVVYYYFWRDGYVRIPEDHPLHFGMGYWIYHENPVVYEIIPGEEIPFTSVQLQCERLGGWYMIGTASGLSEIYSDDASDWIIYKYDQDVGYIEVQDDELLIPGHGYWFKAYDLPEDCTEQIPYVGIRKVIR